MRTLLSIVCAASAFSLLPGCASSPQLRTLSSRTGVVVQTLDASTANFIAIQNDLNASNEARLRVMAAEGERQRQSVSQQRFAWADSGDKVRTAAYALATTKSSTDIIASLAARAPLDTSITSDISGSYAQTTKALAAIAAKPKPWDDFEELITYAQSVNDAYAALQTAAASDAKTTAATTALQDAVTTSAANAATVSPTTP